MVQFEQNGVTVIRKTKGKLPNLPFVRLRNEILGKNYELSIIFSDKKFIQALNKKHRNKNYVPNVLSFPLEKNKGEIYASLDVIRCGAKKEGYTYKTYLPFLVIHSMLHLAGFDHGSKMDAKEAQHMRTFGFSS